MTARILNYHNKNPLFNLLYASITHFVYFQLVSIKGCTHSHSHLGTLNLVYSFCMHVFGLWQWNSITWINRMQTPMQKGSWSAWDLNQVASYRQATVLPTTCCLACVYTLRCKDMPCLKKPINHACVRCTTPLHTHIHKCATFLSRQPNFVIVFPLLSSIFVLVYFFSPIHCLFSSCVHHLCLC